MNSIRLLFLSLCVWYAARLTARAQKIFSWTLTKAMEWNIKDKKSTPAAMLPEPGMTDLMVTPESIPDYEPERERPSMRHRRQRREAAALEAAKVTETPVEPTPEVPESPKDRATLAPETNPFTAGGVDGQVPMCMDPLPPFVVFEAMFQKKYGRHGKCPLSILGTQHAYSALELYALLSKIESDGEKAGPVYNALYGTVVSVIINQHGKQLAPKELN